LKSFLINFLRKHIYLILAAIILFTAGYAINFFLRSNASTRMLRNSIESLLQEREADFDKLIKDTVHIQKLMNRRYGKQELDELLEKQYGPDSPLLLQTLTGESKALRGLGRPEEAAKVEQRIKTISAAMGSQSGGAQQRGAQQRGPLQGPLSPPQ